MPLVLEPLPGGRPLAIDLAGITPDAVGGLDLAAVGRLTVGADERPVALGSLFRIAGSAADGILECHGDFSRVHRIGAGMEGGTVAVVGPAGRHAGEGMRGGTLAIHGDAGDWLASDMRGGLVLVDGSAGDNLAAALPGSRWGMQGGIVVVQGDAGSLAGARLRRGIVAVGGRCGEAAAFEMLAGTVVVAGSIGPHGGVGMRRGSLIAAGEAAGPPPLFRAGSAWSPPFLPLLAARLDAAGFRPRGGSTKSLLAGVWRQWHGDPLAGGRGEIWLRA